MKHIILIALLLYINLAIKAQIQWIADPNPDTETLASSPRNMVEWNGHIYFNAAHNNTQNLWRTDGTTDSTILIKSGLSMEQSASTDHFLFFIGAQRPNEPKLWKSDGSRSGTQVLENIPQDPDQFGPEGLFAMGEKALFFMYHRDGNQVWWASDGSAEGTFPLGSILYSFNWPQKTVADGQHAYIFTKNTPMSWSISKTDGTQASLEEFFSYESQIGSDEFPASPTIIDQTLYFFANNDSVWGLWKSDGTSAGTEFVVSLPSGPNFQLDPMPHIVKWNDALYLLAGSPNSFDGSALWKTTGGQWNLELVHNFGEEDVFFISPGTDKLFLAGVQEHWVSNGTPAGTQLIYSKSTFIRNPQPWLISENSAFTSFDDSLLVSDGTAAGTRMLKNIRKEFVNRRRPAENPELFLIQGKLLFPARGPDEDFDIELWTSDGKESGTYRLKDLNTLPSPANMNEIFLTDDYIYFRAKDTLGLELWRSDGTTQGTFRISDIQPGYPDSSPFGMVEMNGRVYFSARAPEDTSTNTFLSGHYAHLWETDGTFNGTKRVSEDYLPLLPPFSHQFEKIVLNNRLIFGGILRTATGNDFELWTSDGTNAGTHILKDINPGQGPGSSTSSNPQFFVELNGKIYFKAQTLSQGLEWWMTDGTEAGTEIMLDLISGPINGLNYGDDFIKVANRLFFPASANLWFTDGTATGTKIISKNGWASGNYRNDPIIIGELNGEVIFENRGENYDLWITNIDSLKSFQLAANLHVIPDDSRINRCEACHSVLDSIFVFAGNDDINGWQLWRTNGTPEGTWLLRDKHVGVLGSFPQNFVKYDGLTYFIARDWGGKLNIYRTDGQAQTEIADGFDKGDPVFNPRQLFLWQDKLYFVGEHPDYGESLFQFTPGPFVKDERLHKIAHPGYLHIFPNPADIGFAIDFKHSYTGIVEMSILDTSGRSVRHLSFDKTYIRHREFIQLTDLIPGFYIVILNLGNEYLHQKLVIKK